VGSKVVSVQARCAIHTAVVSDWSDSLLVDVGLGPDTEITSVINTYFIGPSEVSEIVNYTDGIPDTVPYGSWIKIFYNGIPTTKGVNECPDTVNKCLEYQINYTRTSVRQPPEWDFTSTWYPFDPEDSNPNGVSDSTTMNMGSVEYTIRARSTDQFDRSDATPPEFEIIGNFDPTLDNQSLENYDGTVIGEGDTIFWDWWNPANYNGSIADTLDVSDPADIKAVKKFYFVVHATGHDHPKEPVGSGVKSWKYTFLQVGSNPPVFEDFGSRAGDFVDAIVLDVLSDTASVTFRYSLTDDPGGAIALNDADFLDKEYESSITGRDLSILDRFDQYMFLSGGLLLVGSYNTADVGRQTDEGRQRFYLRLRR
jgi:hypothetical protein